MATSNPDDAMKDELAAAETLLRDDFGQAWQHFRHLETMRGQYLAFAFTITLASYAAAIPIFANIEKISSVVVVLTGTFVQLYSLILGSLYFGDGHSAYSEFDNAETEPVVAPRMAGVIMVGVSVHLNTTVGPFQDSDDRLGFVDPEPPTGRHCTSRCSTTNVLLHGTARRRCGIRSGQSSSQALFVHIGRRLARNSQTSRVPGAIGRRGVPEVAWI